MTRSALVKARGHPSWHAATLAEPRAFLVLSGSFNPVHTQHIDALKSARAASERDGWTVIGGFLAPSTDAYVTRKLGSAAWPLDMRIALGELATTDSDWIAIWPHADVSSYHVSRAIRQQLLVETGQRARADGLVGIEVMGCDTAIRLLGPIADEWEREAPAAAWYEHRIVCCVPRPGRDAARDLNLINTIIADRIASAGISLMIAEPIANADEPVSSTLIRELVAAHNWEALGNRGWIDSRVLTALKTQANND